MPAKKNNEEETITEELRTWNVAEKLHPDGFYLVLAQRGGGKTTYTEIILQQDPRINESIVVCMCGSSKVKANWIQSVPKLQVVDPDINYLKNMIQTQNRHTAKYAALGLPLPYHLHVDLVLDDVALYAAIMNDAIFHELAASSRNLGMRIFILAQYLLQVPKSSRGGFDGVFLCGNQSEEDLRDLHKKYANFMTRRLFIAAAFTYTKHHGMFVIDRRENECFKMTMTWPFEHIPLGSPSQHSHSAQHYLDLEAQKAKERDRSLMMEEEEQHYLKFEDSRGVIVFRAEPRYRRITEKQLPQTTPSKNNDNINKTKKVDFETGNQEQDDDDYDDDDDDDDDEDDEDYYDTDGSLP